MASQRLGAVGKRAKLERMLLGGLLKRPEAMLDVRRILYPEAFRSRAHAAVYREIKLLSLMRRHGGRMTARSLMRTCRNYTKSQQAESALTDLVAAGLARRRLQLSGKQGGRPVEVYESCMEYNPPQRTW